MSEQSGAGLAGVTELSAWIASREEEPEAPLAAPARVDEEQAEEQQPATPDAQQARDIALRSLGRRAASRRELAQVLARRAVPSEIADEVLDGLERDGYVDDAQLARDAAERLRERKQLGERGIAAELRRRGLDPAQLDEVDVDDELDRAIAAAADRRRRLTSLDDETAERRLAGWLQRRGFSGGVVRIALERTRAKGPRFR